MKISNIENKIDKVKEQIDTIWKDYKCEMCGNEDFLVDEKICGLKTIDEVLTKPLLVLQCKKCGNSKFISLLMI